MALELQYEALCAPVYNKEGENLHDQSSTHDALYGDLKFLLPKVEIIVFVRL